MECSQVLLQLTRFDYSFQIPKKENKIIVLTNAKSSEIFENNGGIKPNTKYIFTFARGQYLCDRTHTCVSI